MPTDHQPARTGGGKTVGKDALPLSDESVEFICWPRELLVRFRPGTPQAASTHLKQTQARSARSPSDLSAAPSHREIARIGRRLRQLAALIRHHELYHSDT